ncbi:MAG: hypothetical protein ABJB86_16665 [Bacteroidota bacterium]
MISSNTVSATVITSGAVIFRTINLKLKDFLGESETGIINAAV